jgi:hypothetical protein
MTMVRQAIDACQFPSDGTCRQNIEEGIELLTGVKAGRLPVAEGSRFEPGSVFDRVNTRLEEFSQILWQAAAPRASDHKGAGAGGFKDIPRAAGLMQCRNSRKGDKNHVPG